MCYSIRMPLTSLCNGGATWKQQIWKNKRRGCIDTLEFEGKRMGREEAKPVEEQEGLEETPQHRRQNKVVLDRTT